MLENIINPIEKGFDHLKFTIKKKLNLFDPLIIYPYRGYGVNGKIYLQGRVLERERVVHDEDTEDSIGANIHRFFKRYESDEIPDVKVEAEFEGEKYTAVTNDEGYYYFEIPYEPKGGKFWKNIKFEIVESPIELKNGKVQTTGEVMVPEEKGDFGIISDVDDTILESHITSLWKKIKILAVNTAESRLAFPGVAALYRSLVKVENNKYKNPIWFVSGSSWNLYDLLDKFCKAKDIPRGPFLLRELSIDAKKFIKQDSITYKVSQIKPLMEETDPLPFILIGDSGQKDPEIYRKIALEYPGRIRAIYIRDVTPDKRDKQIENIADELKEKGIDMILTEDSYEAAKHAQSKGWISEADLNAVKKDVENEKQKSTAAKF